MIRGRLFAAVVVALPCLAATVQAQPVDPYTLPPAPAPAPPPAPTPAPAPQPSLAPNASDPGLAEQIAQSLVARAQELVDARAFADAKLLVQEALARSPAGAAAAQARALLAQIDNELGVAAAPAQPDPAPNLESIGAPVEQGTLAGPEQPARASRIPAGIHAGLYGALLGATAGSFFSEDTSAGGAALVGAATGIAAGLYAPRLADRFHWSDAQIRTMGAASVWGGVIGGFFADTVKTSGSSGREILVGGSIGATAGAVGGALLARKRGFTTGDIALVDTLAGMGALGGLTVGMIMQPVETEAYSVNAMVGAAAGVVAGLVAAPQTHTTPRRMVRVAGLAAAGGALPFLLYAGIRDGSTESDERLTGALASVGLLAGAWLGFRLTRDLDVDRDVLPGARPRDDDAPAALVGRHSDGRWTPGALAIQALSPQLAPQRGMAVPLVGAAF